jgi:uncharacterized membrane protein
MNHKLSWAVFVLTLLSVILFVALTAPRLPALVASHFDAAGVPTAFVARGIYLRFVLLIGVGLPIVLVALLAWVYSRARDMKLPNKDYWLAPERIAATRALLVSQAVWFGTLLAAIVCYVHWLELDAHRSAPPQLSNPLFGAGLMTFLVIAMAWSIAILMAFRRPRPPRIRVEPPLE